MNLDDADFLSINENSLGVFRVIVGASEKFSQGEIVDDFKRLEIMHLERRSIFQRVDEKCLPNNKKIPNKKKLNPPLINFVMIDDFKYPLFHFGSANYIHHNFDARLKMSIEFYHFAFYEFLIRYLSNIKLPALREKLKFVHRNLSGYLDEMSRRMYAELLLCECHIEESFNKDYFLMNKHHSLKLILNKWKAFHQYQAWMFFLDETSFIEFGLSVLEKKWILLTSETQKEYQKLFFPHGVIFNSLTCLGSTNFLT